jgi:hypothetical protein
MVKNNLSIDEIIQFIALRTYRMFKKLAQIINRYFACLLNNKQIHHYLVSLLIVGLFIPYKEEKTGY